MVRDALAMQMTRWHAFIAEAVTRAVATGELDRRLDAAQVAFEISALLDAANDASLLFDTSAPYARARAAIRALLARL
jgi:hypothetical protein